MEVFLHNIKHLGSLFRVREFYDLRVPWGAKILLTELEPPAKTFQSCLKTEKDSIFSLFWAIYKFKEKTYYFELRLDNGFQHN